MTTSPSASNRSISSGSAKIQHDQIPQNYHSSASYKQELMDASILLDNINEALCVFDNDKKSVHSLQPQYLSVGMSTAAMYPSTTLSSLHAHAANAHNHNSSNRHRHRSSSSSKHKHHHRKRPRSGGEIAARGSSSSSHHHHKHGGGSGASSSSSSSARASHHSSSHHPHHRHGHKYKAHPSVHKSAAADGSSSKTKTKTKSSSSSALHHHSHRGGGRGGGSKRSSKAPPMSALSSAYQPPIATAAMIGPHSTYFVKDDSHISSRHSSSSSRLHKKRRTVPLHVQAVDNIPTFVAQNTRRIQLLKEMIEIKRSELERVSKRHDNTVNSIIDLYMHAADAINSLRKQYRQLSLYAEQLSREGRKRSEQNDKMLQTLHAIEEQRKELLNKIEAPAWEIKHHFHILSFEHFRGNQQPHLLEIAEVLPSRLQIAAIAHSSSMKNDRLLMKFHRTRKERDLLFNKLGQIDNKRNLTQAHLKDYKKMMTIIKKNIGESRLNKLRKERERMKKLKKEQELRREKERQLQRQKHMLQSRLGLQYSRMSAHSHSGSPSLNARQNHSSPFLSASSARNMSPAAPPAMAGVPNAAAGFRLNYLRHIGIEAPKKVKFDLIHFIIEINTYLGLMRQQTMKELNELKNVSNLINPLTGQVQNPTTTTTTATAGAITGPTAEEGNEDSEDEHNSEEKNETASSTSGGESPASTSTATAQNSASAGNAGHASESDPKQSKKSSKKKKSKFKHRLVMKQKSVRQNILSVIDSSEMTILAHVTEVGPLKKTTYTVSLLKKHSNNAGVLSAAANVNQNHNNNSNQNDRHDDGEFNNSRSSLISSSLSHPSDGNAGGGGGGGVPEPFIPDPRKSNLDEPHSDWSVLARHLKDSSKESARRKQILKQLERILHVREGLSLGFEQLKQLYDVQEDKQIVGNKNKSKSGSKSSGKLSKSKHKSNHNNNHALLSADNLVQQ